MDKLFHPKYGWLAKGKKKYKRLGNKIVQLWVDSKGVARELDGAETTEPKQDLMSSIEQIKGKPGPRGLPGKDADENRIIKAVLSRIPIPKNGKDADENKIINIVVDEVLERIPVPKDGETPRVDYQKIISKVLSSVPIPKDGKDGQDGKIAEHKWEGTKLFFKQANGEWGTGVDLRGKQGDQGGGHSFTGQVKSSVLDAIPGFLSDKLVAGTNVTITESGDKDKKITIASTASSTGGHTIQEEGTDLTARTNLNFVGAGVTATDDAGNDATLVTIPDYTLPTAAAATLGGVKVGDRLSIAAGVLSADVQTTDITGKASLALDNLASVAINTSLISDTDSTDDLGSSTKYWKDAYIDSVLTKGNPVFNALAYAGADIGAQINAAYADLPASGGIIFVPTGSYSFSTPIVLNTGGKGVLLKGAAGGGTQLSYTGGGTTVAITFDEGLGHSSGQGIDGIYLSGPSSAGTTVGLKIGGTVAACEGSSFRNMTITGFGTGVTFLSNAYIIGFSDIAITGNGTNILFPAGLSNWGENISFVKCNISDSVSPLASVKITTQNFLNVSFINCSFDNSQIDIQSTEGTIKLNLFGCHFENPSGDTIVKYPFIKIAAPAIVTAHNIVNLTNCDFYEVADTNKPDQFILNNGTVFIYGVVAEAGPVIDNFITGTGKVYNNGFFSNLFWNGADNVPCTTNFCNGNSNVPISIEDSSTRLYSIDNSGNITTNNLSKELLIAYSIVL